MSFAGHVFDMINRFQYNESLRKHRRERYRKIKNAYMAEVKLYDGELTQQPDIPKEKMDQIRKTIRTTLIRERRAAITKSIIATIIVVSAISYFIYYLISNGAFEGFYF
jgi:hypothetical protein